MNFQITWTGPDGSPLPHDVTPLEPNILDFANGRQELNGDYTCTAKNTVGEASDHGTVLIGDTIEITIEPSRKKFVFVVGDPVNIKCKVFKFLK